MLAFRHLLDAIEVSSGLRILLTVSRLLERDLPLTNICLLLIYLLRRIIDDQLFRNVFTKNKDTIFLGHNKLGLSILRWVRIDIWV